MSGPIGDFLNSAGAWIRDHLPAFPSAPPAEAASSSAKPAAASAATASATAANDGAKAGPSPTAAPSQPPRAQAPDIDSDSDSDDDDDATASQASQAKANGAAEVKRVFKPLDKELSLIVHFYSLLYHIDQHEVKARETTLKAEEARQKKTLIRTVQDKIFALTAPDRTVDFTTDAEVSQLFKNLSTIGVPVDPKKTVYTKEEREALLTTLDRANRRFEDELQIHTQTVKKCTETHQELFKMLMSLMKEYADMVKKWIELIYRRN